MTNTKQKIKMKREYCNECYSITNHNLEGVCLRHNPTITPSKPRVKEEWTAKNNADCKHSRVVSDDIGYHCLDCWAYIDKEMIGDPHPILKVEGEREELVKLIKRWDLSYNEDTDLPNNQDDVDGATEQLSNFIQSHHSHLLSTLGRRVREMIDETIPTYRIVAPFYEERNTDKDKLLSSLTALLSSMEGK